jgi:pyruvate/2-oxoglutarate dehydrogenase complex dihydrolipoamide acyltransferase (E2) component
MDPFAPINGISLERYAELGALVADCVQDREQCAAIVAAQGVRREDWNAAVAGWTARMQDPSLMGRVAMAYMPLSQAALARKGPVAQASFEDFVSLSAAIKVMGLDGMCRAYGITPTQWSQIGSYWTATMGREMQRYASYSPLVESEAQRLRAGGQPRPAPSLLAAQQNAPAQPAAPAAPNPAAAAQAAQNQAAAAEAQARVQAALAASQQQAAAAYGRAGPNPFAAPFAAAAAQNVAAYHSVAQQIANSPGQAAPPPPAPPAPPPAPPAAGFAAGTNVLVQWSDGNRYPGQVVYAAPGQLLIAFPDGRQRWIPQQYVSQ